MATVKEALTEKMVGNGLWPQESAAILDGLNAPSLVEALNKNWDDYPTAFKATAWLIVCDAVVRWIDEHKPLHFARPMFVLGEGAG